MQEDQPIFLQEAGSLRRARSALRGDAIFLHRIALARVGEEWGDGDGEAECVDDEARVAGIDGVRAGGGDGVAGGGFGKAAAETAKEAREAQRMRVRIVENAAQSFDANGQAQWRRC